MDITPADIEYRPAATKREYEAAAGLFREYADSLAIDLGFQDFELELKTLDRQYQEPRGLLLLAYQGEEAIGCVGIRELDGQTAELKRMYVRKAWRKYGIGRKLIELAIDAAAGIGYRSIRLDTLPVMDRAQQLYRSFGFYEIPPYRFNPVSGAIFMEKKLGGTIDKAPDLK